MPKPYLLYISQYSDKYWARTLKELKEKVGPGKVSIMYVDKKDGRTVRAGYVIGRLWLTAFMPYEKEV
jgi:DNA polymerase/3'-5' exonuclease PolX